MHAVAQLLDRLAAADEAAFLVTWTEQMLSGRARLDPALAVRLLRAYRETGRVDRARELAASLPSSPSSWNPLDTARLAIERAIICTIDGRADHAEADHQDNGKIHEADRPNTALAGGGANLLNLIAGRQPDAAPARLQNEGAGHLHDVGAPVELG